MTEHPRSIEARRRNGDELTADEHLALADWYLTKADRALYVTLVAVAVALAAAVMLVALVLALEP